MHVRVHAHARACTCSAAEEPIGQPSAGGDGDGREFEARAARVAHSVETRDARLLKADHRVRTYYWCVLVLVLVLASAFVLA